MKKNWIKLAAFLGFLALTAMPVAVMANGVGVGVRLNIGADDQAHFDFKAGQRHYHPAIWKAAKQLRNAKHTLYKAADDFHGHKMEAIRAINAALDQLMVCSQR